MQLCDLFPWVFPRMIDSRTFDPLRAERLLTPPP